jgi:hypothetical protein
MLRTIGGWALLSNAVLTLVLLIGTIVAQNGGTLSLVTAEALCPLFLAGLLGISTVLPRTGRLAQIGRLGLWCLAIAAGIAFVVRLVLLFSSTDTGDLAPLSSALFALAGSLLLGWATIQGEAFPRVIGWLLIVSGVLNLLGGLLPASAGTSLVGLIATLAEVGALGGYGWRLLRGARVVQGASLQRQ